MPGESTATIVVRVVFQIPSQCSACSQVTGLGHEPFSLASKKIKSESVLEAVGNDGMGGLVIKHCYLCEKGTLLPPGDDQLQVLVIIAIYF